MIKDLVNRKKVREVKYFHPSGKSLPNGSHIQRGGFLHECRQNKDAYVLSESVHGEQHGPAKYRGGVITFPAGINAPEWSDKDSFGGAYSVGHCFKGKYVSDNGETYDETSFSIEVNGLSSQSLLQLAEHLAETVLQKTILVKDLNNGKIWMVSP
jgi:hypothetical protein